MHETVALTSPVSETLPLIADAHTRFNPALHPSPDWRPCLLPPPPKMMLYRRPDVAACARPLTEAEIDHCADVLAAWPGIAHEPVAAADLPVGWYANLLTPVYCSYDDAGVVRLRTMLRCRQVRDERLRNQDALRRLNLSDEVRPGDHVTGLLLLLVLVAAMVLYAVASPTDRQLRDATVRTEQVGR